MLIAHEADAAVGRVQNDAVVEEGEMDDFTRELARQEKEFREQLEKKAKALKDELDQREYEEQERLRLELEREEEEERQKKVISSKFRKSTRNLCRNTRRYVMIIDHYVDEGVTA